MSSPQRFRFGLLPSYVLVAVLSAVGMHAQSSSPVPTSPVLEQLVQRVKASISKAHARQVLIVPLANCLLDEARCLEFDSRIRIELTASIPNVRLLNAEDLIPAFKARGLLSIDVYNSELVDRFASATGAELHLTESLGKTDRGYELRIRLSNSLTRKETDQFFSKEFRPLPVPGDEPVLLKDRDENVWLVVPKNEKLRYPASGNAVCDHCPFPSFTTEMHEYGVPWKGSVELLATITAEGRPVDVRPLTGFSQQGTDYTAKAVQGWLFKPALKPDGTPYAVRKQIEITYETK